jgi:hypothetical protein
MPFGHVADLPDQDWRSAVAAVRPDVVWAQLNWRAVPLAVALRRHLRRHLPEVPFVWHFKESPQRSRVRGEWPLLAELLLTADASLVATEEERRWLLDALPGRLHPESVGVLDGDLPLAEWLRRERSPRLSEADGEPHTVVLGRPLGFDLDWVTELAELGVHLHLYGQVDAPGPKGSWRAWWDAARSAYPRHLHLHPAVGPEDWVRVLSRYDAGWLHRVGSRNDGDLRRATWDDLNSPARLPVLMAAGLPVLVPDTRPHAVAVHRITTADRTALGYRSAEDVAATLRDPARLERAREAAWAVRDRYTFDHHADRLVSLFRRLRQ